MRKRKAKPTFEAWFKSIKRSLFDAAFDIDVCGFSTINDLADHADLSWSTVQNLYEGTTKEPRMRTMFKVAAAVELDFGLLQELYEDATRITKQATHKKRSVRRR